MFRVTSNAVEWKMSPRPDPTIALRSPLAARAGNTG
jgi:hypothetical protein